MTQKLTAYTPPPEELLHAIKGLCDELSDEKNYHLPAWCPGTLAEKASRYTAIVLIQVSERLSRLKQAEAALEIHTGKKAPVQGYAPGIPWDMHMEAYAAYCKKYGKQDALIEGWCRGGFGTCELDMFIPGWRDELKRRHDSSRATCATLKEENAERTNGGPDA